MEHYGQHGELPQDDFLDKYYDKFKDRFREIVNNIYDASWIGDSLIYLTSKQLDDKAAQAITAIIKQDLNKRDLLAKKP